MGKILNIGYGCVFGTYWMIYAVVSSFSSIFLLAEGYTNSEIGATLAVANVLAVIIQPVIADFADRSRRIGVIGLTEIITAMIMLFMVGMFTFSGGTPALCVIFVLVIAWHTVMQPLFNAMAFRLEETGYSINFGAARAVGSLAYAVLVAILGTMVEKFGTGLLPVTGEITCALLIVSLVFVGLNFHKTMKQKITDDRRFIPHRRGTGYSDEITLIQFVNRNKLFFLVNVGVVGLFFSNAVLNNYMAQIVDGVEGSTGDMGRILSLMAALEIPTMVFFNRIKERFSCRLLLKVAAVGFAVKITICWLADSVLMLYIGQVFQLVSFALWLPGIVHFTDEIMSKGEAVKGQALFTTMVTVTTIFSSLLGGWILDMAGPKMLTFIATLATAAGAMLKIAVIDKIEDKVE